MVTTAQAPVPDARSSPEVEAAMRQIDRLLLLVNQPITVTSLATVPNELHNWELVAPALVFSAASCLVSLRHLADAATPRRELDASMLIRRLYEHTVDFAWLAINPQTNVPRWVADDFHHRLLTDNDFIRLGRGKLDPATRRHFEAEASRHKRMPQVHQLADAADAYWAARIKAHGTFPATPAPPGLDLTTIQNGRWSLRSTYAFIYRPASANAHPTPRSLYDYVWGTDRAGQFTIGMSRRLTSSERFAYTMAPLVFAILLHIAEQVLGRPASADVRMAFESLPQDG